MERTVKVDPMEPNVYAGPVGVVSGPTARTHPDLPDVPAVTIEIGKHKIHLEIRTSLDLSLQLKDAITKML